MISYSQILTATRNNHELYRQLRVRNKTYGESHQGLLSSKRKKRYLQLGLIWNDKPLAKLSLLCLINSSCQLGFKTVMIVLTRGGCIVHECQLISVCVKRFHLLMSILLCRACNIWHKADAPSVLELTSLVLFFCFRLVCSMFSWTEVMWLTGWLTFGPRTVWAGLVVRLLMGSVVVF